MRARFFPPTLLAAAIAVLAGCGGGGHGGSGSSSGATITAEPASTTAAAGGTATFSVGATGSGLTYQWYRNSMAISGATSSTYTTAALTSSDSGATFYVVITSSSGGSVKSSVVTLTVGAAGSPSITTQPSSVSAPVGGSATFAVVATGDNLTYQWYKGTAAIDGAASASYTVSPVAATSAGNYNVVVSNSSGSVTSRTVALTIGAASAPTITTQPASETLAVGARASFSVAASGSATLTYQWSKDGTAISGATGSTYGFTTTTDSSGSYTVTITNGLGSVTSSAATLIVESAPTIITQPSPATTAVYIGASVTYSVVASGTNLSYQWLKDSSAISGATGASYTIAAASAADAGTYRVLVTNLAGSATSSSVSLTVYGAPTITTQPSSTSAGQGSTATFTVGATGNDLSFQWTKNGNAISGATSTSYVTPATALSDSGATFDCVVTNPSGSATSSSATLTVVPTPTITTQPTSQTVTAPATATFSVTATAPSGGTLTYAWYQVGSTTVLSTASSYTTPATDSSYNGAQYYVVVTNNGIASVTSNTVTLTVH